MPENIFFHQFDVPNVSEHEKEQIESFLLYRKENARKLNDEVIFSYYQGGLTSEEMKNRLGLSDEQVETVSFMLDSFRQPKSPDKLKRKDGSYIAVHSLQLFLTARDFFGIKDNDLLDTLLVHDIAEDTQVSLQDIAEKIGTHKSELAAAMTEARDESQPNDALLRKKDVVVFAEQIKHAGSIAATAEIIDRIDDITDLSYLLDDLVKKDNVEDKNKIKEKLLAKFAKCEYTVQKVEHATNLEGKKLAEYFRMLLKHQLSLIHSSYGIAIEPAELEREIGIYKELERQLTKPEE